MTSVLATSTIVTTMAMNAMFDESYMMTVAPTSRSVSTRPLINLHPQVITIITTILQVSLRLRPSHLYLIMDLRLHLIAAMIDSLAR